VLDFVSGRYIILTELTYCGGQPHIYRLLTSDGHPGRQEERNCQRRQKLYRLWR